MLVEGFSNRRGRNAIRCLAYFFDLATQENRREVSFGQLLVMGPSVLSAEGVPFEDSLSILIGPAKLLQIRRTDTGEVIGGMPGEGQGADAALELAPEAQSAFGEVRDRVRAYAALFDRLGEGDLSPPSPDPLRRAMVEAAHCFNAGLFFEAHEHLEHHWRGQPKGPMKQFLQGIIQISVGFHHALEGRFYGATNQLRKGLDKTGGMHGNILGLDCDSFLLRVTEAWNLLVARGPVAMRSMPLEDIPSMPIV
jgi:hypothetical protein